MINALRLKANIEIAEIPGQALSLEETKTNELINDSKIKKILFEKLNFELANNLAEMELHKDVLKSQAYKKIAERTGVESKQLGVMAEQVIIGVLEGLAIDRPDLKMSVLEANAYQDVNDKIDFIISTKQKNRGVGVNREDVLDELKSIGIQFTTNKTKAEHKANQILKSKERGLEVDDIVYVELDNKTLHDAVAKWEKGGRPITGPWKFLSAEVRTKVINDLFVGILKEEDIKSLTKNLK